MVTTYRYFSIAFDAVPDQPEYPVWYQGWTQERPKGASAETLVVGVTSGPLPPGAIELGGSSKDPPPPPPPPPPAPNQMEGLRRAFATWLAAGRGA